MGEFFPPVTLRILECEYDDLFRQLHDTDLVILPDVLAEKGQSVEAEMQSVLPMRGYKDEWRSTAPNKRLLIEAS